MGLSLLRVPFKGSVEGYYNKCDCKGCYEGYKTCKHTLF